MVYKQYAQDQLDNINGIIRFVNNKDDLLGIHVGAAWGLNNRRLAYILATAEHDSNFRPIEEIGGAKKSYNPYFGRGYVQLTHKKNYVKYGELLNLDLLNRPDLALQEEVARVVLVHGMTYGWFTGKKLSDYIDKDHGNYVGARWIVNAQDNAQLIAKMAEFWEGYLFGNNTIGTRKAN
ncbi:hypothetical protein BG006_011165 [Podila minutissima]|uniref:Glycoside hydrolase family 19 catalytic domain-containing protein n=1 Tax=Podila minutissima TaxID=64525 RepID=A0A9P5SC77_9FUNG|nr:hypothetical protein BG006_011165 [Podila minutissima]